MFSWEAAERIITDFSDITAALRFGDKQRHVEETKMNERSSRSHTIFKITLESKERVSDDGDEEEDGAVLVAHLNLVDLADLRMYVHECCYPNSPHN